MFQMLLTEAKPNTLKIHVYILHNQNPIALKTSIPLSHNKDSIQINTLKFYISTIDFYNKGKIIYSDNKYVHLVNFEDSSSTELNITYPNKLTYDQLKITIGIDSLKNASGNMDGDLSPLKNMYWTWQSGYINLKIEGKFISKENNLEYHIGGYREPYACIEQISPIEINQDEYELRYNVDSFINYVESNKSQKIMSPGKSAYDFFKMFMEGFK